MMGSIIIFIVLIQLCHIKLHILVQPPVTNETAVNVVAVSAIAVYVEPDVQMFCTALLVQGINI